MRLYRVLLRLYPASFRHEYGDEMAAIFRDRLREAAGPVGFVALWLATCAEVLANAAVTHGDLLRQDLQIVGRTLRRSPGFALTAVLVVGLGTGANTAVFSVTDHALLRPLPFPEPDRLVKLWESRPGYTRMELSPANYRDWREGTQAFASMGAFFMTAANLTGEGDPVRIRGFSIQGDVLETLRVAPELGRGITAADTTPGAPDVVLLSHALWQSRFGGDPTVLGRQVRLDGQPYEIVGVMPPEFCFPTPETQYWRPLVLTEGWFEDRNDNSLQVVARLRAGVTIEAAAAELDVVTQRLQEQYPVENENAGFTILRLREEFSRQSRLLLLTLGGAAACILLIACVNLTNLLLARTVARRRELVVRAAMGAGRERLTRLVLTETVSLALLGGGLGVGVAYAAVPLLTRLIPTTLPVAGTPSLDLRVLAFACLVTLATGIGLGLAPLLRLGDVSAEALREDGRSTGGARERLRGALVVAGVVSSVVLLVGSGLLLRAMWRVQSTDPGFQVGNVLTLRTALPLPEYAPTDTRVRYYTEVTERILALPDVSGAAFISFLPMQMTGGIWPVEIETGQTRREQGHAASLRFVTPGFFAAMGIPVHRGRDVERADTQDRPFVAVVSESFAERYWPGQDPIGKRFRFAFFEREIVGVAGDIRVRGLERDSEPQVYLPAGQVPDGGLWFYAPKDLVVRSTATARTLLPAVRSILREIDPDQPISNVQTLGDIVASQTAARGTQLRIFVAFAATALLLAGVGIHGLLSFLVSQRRREIGVRVALGAKRGDILGMVVRRGALLAAAGIVPGMLIAFGAGRAFEAVLAGIPPADPWTYLATALLCGVTTLAGSLLPAWRAARVDPVEAMRT